MGKLNKCFINNIFVLFIVGNYIKYYFILKECRSLITLFEQGQSISNSKYNPARVYILNYLLMSCQDKIFPQSTHLKILELLIQVEGDHQIHYNFHQIHLYKDETRMILHNHLSYYL